MAELNSKPLNQVTIVGLYTNRKAVAPQNPGLPRFAATLGKGVTKDSNPETGCAVFA
jgi:hypothetical protein